MTCQKLSCDSSKVPRADRAYGDEDIPAKLRPEDLPENIVPDLLAPEFES